jgi:hypothetical protein
VVKRVVSTSSMPHSSQPSARRLIRVGSCGDLPLAPGTPAKKVHDMVEHGEFLIRHPDLAIGQTDDRAAVEADHVMMVAGSAEDISYRSIRLREGPTESRFG